MSKVQYKNCPHCNEPISDQVLVMETHLNWGIVSDNDPNTLLVGYLDTSGGGAAKWFCDSCDEDISDFIVDNYTIEWA